MRGRVGDARAGRADSLDVAGAVVKVGRDGRGRRDGASEEPGTKGHGFGEETGVDHVAVAVVRILILLSAAGSSAKWGGKGCHTQSGYFQAATSPKAKAPSDRVVVRMFLAVGLFAEASGRVYKMQAKASDCGTRRRIILIRLLGTGAVMQEANRRKGQRGMA